MSSPLRSRFFYKLRTPSTVLCAAIVAAWLLHVIATSPPVWAQGQATDITADEVNKVARQLWCPLCGGRLRLDSCELKACAQMREVIAIKLAEGEDAQSIRDYFLEQYGPQILGEPPRQGLNWLAWIVPVVAVTGGGLFLWLRMRLIARPHELSLARAGGGEADEHERRLDEELARYD